MGKTIDELFIQIEADSSNAGYEINAVADALRNLKSATSGSNSGLEKTAKGISSLGDADLKDNGGKLNQIAESISKINGVTISSTIGKQLSSIVSTVSTISNETLDKLDRLCTSLERLKGLDSIKVNLNTGSVSTGYGTTGGVVDVDGDKTVNTGGNASGILPTGSVKQVSELTKRLRILGQQIKRIAFYRLLRGALKGIASAVKEGITNVYEYSKAIGGSFADSMDRISASLQYLKNSIGAAVAPLIEILTPAIEWLSNVISKGADAVNQFLSVLSGKTEWTHAIKQTNKLNEAIKRLTYSFDELNKLGDTGDSKASGFVTEKIESNVVTDLAVKVNNVKVSVAEKVLSSDFGADLIESVAKASKSPVSSALSLITNSTGGISIKMLIDGIKLVASSVKAEVDSKKTKEALNKAIAEAATKAVNFEVHLKVSPEAQTEKDIYNSIQRLKIVGTPALYANGGFPDTGSLFIAGEAGAEYVGNVGGRTAVYNADEMTSALSTANQGVISAIYGMANAVVNAVNSKDSNVYLDGSAIGRSQNRYQAIQSKKYGTAGVF